MLDQNQAKQKFRSTLTLLLVTVGWPFIVTVLIASAGVKPTGLITLIMALIWPILFIWLFVQLWQSAKEVGTTPWATLWLFLPGFGLLITAMLFLEPLKYRADGKPENRRLPPSWNFIKEIWKFYVDNFKTSFKTSVLYLYLFLILGVLMAVLNFWQPDWMPIFALILIPPTSLASLYIMLRLLAQTAALDSNQTGIQSIKIDGKKFLSCLWIVFEAIVIAAGPLILSCLIIAAVALLVGGWQSILTAVMPEAANQPGLTSMNQITLIVLAVLGLVLAIPSCLWLMYKSNIWNSLTLPVFLFQNKKGYSALKECNRIAKNRWWGLFWKNQLTGLVFGAYGMLISLGMSVAAVLLTFIFQFLHAGNIIANFLSQGLNGVIQMIIMPLLIVYYLKLYRAFSQTAE